MAKTNNPKPPTTAAPNNPFEVPSGETPPSTPAAQSLHDASFANGQSLAEKMDAAGAASISPETAESLPPQLAPTPARQGDELRPYCQVHLCLMRANGSTDKVTNYACPVPGCRCKEKRARPQFRISPEPKLCPSITCKPPGSRQQYLEVVPAKSTIAFHHFQCPKCNFSIKQPRPQLDPRRKPPPTENLTDR